MEMSDFSNEINEPLAKELYQEFNNKFDKNSLWVFKGKWQADIQYHYNDVVSYNNIILHCIKDHFSNHYINEDIDNWEFLTPNRRIDDNINGYMEF